MSDTNWVKFFDAMPVQINVVQCKAVQRNVIQIYVILCVFLLLTGACSDASEPIDELYRASYSLPGTTSEATVSAAPIKTTVSDPIRLEVAYPLDSRYHIALLGPLPDETAGFEISPAAYTDDVSGDIIIRRYVWQLTAEDTGSFQPLPPALELTRLNADGSVNAIERIQPEPVPVEIIALTDEKTPIPDIFHLLKPRFKIIYFVYALFAGLIAACIAYYAAKTVRLRRQTVSAEPTPLESVLSRLNELEKNIEEESINANELHTELNDVLKFYLQRHLRIILPGETIEEGLRRIESSPDLPQKNADIIHEFCQLTDLIKFAGFESESKTGMDALAQIKALIRVPR